MSFKIDRITVQNFRGIRHLNLPVNGRNLIILGENGSGKSSIVDALEYYFTDRVSQLEGRSDVSKWQSIPNLNGGPTAVALTFNGAHPGQEIAKSFPKGRINVPKPLKSFFDLTHKCAFILRRAQLLNFINARDAERYRQVSQLINLGELDKIEQNWKKACGEKEKEVIRLVDQEGDIFERLAELTGYPVSSEEALIKAVNDLLIQPQLPPIDNQGGMKATLNALQQNAQSVDSTIEQLRGIQHDMTQLTEQLDSFLAAQPSLQTAVHHFWRQIQSLADADLEKLLLEGQKVLIADMKRQTCPLCNSSVGQPALLQQIGGRLSRLHDVTNSRQQVEQQKEVVTEKLVILLEHLSSLAKSLKAMEEERPLSAMRAAYARLRDWKKQLETEEWHTVIQTNWGEETAVCQLQQALAQFVAETTHIITAQASSEDESVRQELLHILTRVDEKWHQLAGVQSALTWARYVADQVDRVYQHLLTARKSGVENLLSAFESDFDHFYRQLHPDEGYEAITIPVQKQRRSSLALRVGFHEQKASHPLNFFSEGHMDSLGLCIFLAFIKRFNGNLKLIVLDDVLTTVDSAHRLRVAQMLTKEFVDYQFIITTHDQLWAKELEHILPQASLVTLKSWSLEQGATCQKET